MGTASMTLEHSASEEDLKSVIKFFTAALSIADTLGYVLERAARFPQLNTETSNVDPALNARSEKGPYRLNDFIAHVKIGISVVKYVNYTVTLVKFVGPLYARLHDGKDVKFLGYHIKKDQTWLRVVVGGGMAVVGAAALVGVLANLDRIKAALEPYQDMIAMVGPVVVSLQGIFQTILLIQDFPLYEGRKLFAIANATKNLTAFFEFPGLDKWVYRLDGGAGQFYLGVYGARAVIKGAETVGVLTAA